MSYVSKSSAIVYSLESGTKSSFFEDSSLIVSSLSLSIEGFRRFFANVLVSKISDGLLRWIFGFGVGFGLNFGVGFGLNFGLHNFRKGFSTIEATPLSIESVSLQSETFLLSQKKFVIVILGDGGGDE